MMFDLSPLQTEDLLFFGLSFLSVYFMVGFLLKRPGGFLRKVREKGSLYYAGPVLVGTVAFLAYLSLEDILLKLGLLSAVLVLLVVGAVDEKRGMRADIQFFWQLVITAVVVFGGWTISFVSHPLADSVLFLNYYQLGVFVFPGSLLAIFWLLLLMNAVNWLDGLDGLALSVGTVSLITLALLALLPSVQDDVTLLLSLVGAGGCLGLLVWNFPPARVYLGTSGSWFLGLYVGMVAILTGGKIVTTMLVLAIPLFDLFFVMILRLLDKRPPWQGDRKFHWHYRLAARGFSVRQILGLVVLASMVLGWIALALQTYQKIFALLVVGIMLVLVSIKLLWKKLRAGTYF